MIQKKPKRNTELQSFFWESLDVKCVKTSVYSVKITGRLDEEQIQKSSEGSSNVQQESEEFSEPSKRPSPV